MAPIVHTHHTLRLVYPVNAMPLEEQGCKAFPYTLLYDEAPTTNVLDSAAIAINNLNKAKQSQEEACVLIVVLVVCFSESCVSFVFVLLKESSMNHQHERFYCPLYSVLLMSHSLILV